MIKVGSRVRSVGSNSLRYAGVVVAYVPPWTSGRLVASRAGLPGCSRIRHTMRPQGSWLVLSRDTSRKGKRGRGLRTFWPTRVEEVKDGE